MEYSTPFVHAFETQNHKYLYDVNTNTILQVSDVVFDVINYYHTLSPSQIAEKYKEKYDKDVIKKGISEIQTLEEAKFLSKFRPARIRYPRDRTEIVDELETNMRSLTLNVTEDCNMRCRYCVFSGNYKGMRTHAPKYMNFDVAKRAINYYFSHSLPQVNEVIETTIGFYGGEPLLNFNLIKKCVEYVKELTKKGNNRRMIYSMTTNGTLLNDEIIDFIAQNSFSLIISLDGPKSRHDANRIFKNGSGTFDTVIANIQKIKSKYPDYYRFNVKFAITTPPPIDYMEIDEFITSSDLIAECSGILQAAVIPGTTYLKRFKPYELVDLEGEKKAWQKYINGVVSGRTKEPLFAWEYAFVQSLFGVNLYKIKNRAIWTELTEIHHPGGICQPGQLKLLLSTEGRYYPCEKIFYTNSDDDISCIDNIEDGIDVDKVIRLIEQYCALTEEDCVRCWLNRMCPVCFALITPSNDKELTPEDKKQVCAGIRTQMHYALKGFCEIMEKNPYAWE